VKVLLDENLDHALRTLLGQHDVVTVTYMGWTGLKNSELLQAAEDNGIEVFVTGDQTLAYEQNLTGRRLAIIALSAIQLPIIKQNLSRSLPLSIMRCPVPSKQSIPVLSAGKSPSVNSSRTTYRNWSLPKRRIENARPATARAFLVLDHQFRVVGLTICSREEFKFWYGSRGNPNFWMGFDAFRNRSCPSRYARRNSPTVILRLRRKIHLHNRSAIHERDPHSHIRVAPWFIHHQDFAICLSPKCF
jgi:predicted nuclease of predicted toxin-antitoxin system